jgi:hypothetical protein
MARGMLVSKIGLAGFLIGFPALAQVDVAKTWGTRSPMVCTPLKQKNPPNAAQAAKLVQCAKENASEASGELWLMQNLKVEVGKAMSFLVAYDQYIMAAADTTKRVYPIRGSFDWAICITMRDAGIYGNPNENCKASRVPTATGVCWQTTFGDWKCTINGAAEARRPTKRPL